MKKILSTALLAAAVLMLGSCAKSSQKDYILATGGTSGTYYPSGILKSKT